jgi:hypothetical protein
MTHTIIIINFLKMRDLDYNQMYTFVFDHDYKFWTFLAIKDI